MCPEAIPKGPIAKILYIEDDLGLARLLRKNLHRLGYAVELAFSGEDGLRIIGEQPFDILLVDHHLPGMSGLEVIEALRLDKIPIPIVMVTANGSELVAVEALKRGACDYLVKDVELHFLQLLPVIVQKLLNQQRLILGCYRTMESLRATEDSYRKVMEGIGEGIAVSVQGRIEMLNPAGALLLGLDHPEQAIGRCLDDFFLPFPFRNAAVRPSSAAGRGALGRGLPAQAGSPSRRPATGGGNPGAAPALSERVRPDDGFFPA